MRRRVVTVVVAVVVVAAAAVVLERVRNHRCQVTADREMQRVHSDFEPVRPAVWRLGSDATVLWSFRAHPERCGFARVVPPRDTVRGVARVSPEMADRLRDRMSNVAADARDVVRPDADLFGALLPAGVLDRAWFALLHPEGEFAFQPDTGLVVFGARLHVAFP